MATLEKMGCVDDRPTEVRDLLSMKELAAKLGVSQRHISRLTDAGKIPGPILLGRLRRWRRRDIEGWLDAGCPAVGASGGKEASRG